MATSSSEKSTAPEHPEEWIKREPVKLVKPNGSIMRIKDVPELTPNRPADTDTI